MTFEDRIPGDEVSVIYAIAILFMLDIALNFNTAFYQNGKMVTSRRDIAKYYLETWLFLDLIATFPFDWIVVAHYKESDI